MEAADDRLLTVQEAAKYFQVKVSTIYNWTHIGYIPRLKIGRMVRFKRNDIEDWLSKRSVKGRKECIPKVRMGAVIQVRQGSGGK